MFEKVDKLKNIEATKSSQFTDDVFDVEKDINLLPDEMKKEEGKIKPKPRASGDLEMHIPGSLKAKQEKSATGPLPPRHQIKPRQRWAGVRAASWFKRLFKGRKIKDNRGGQASAELLNQAGKKLVPDEIKRQQTKPEPLIIAAAEKIKPSGMHEVAADILTDEEDNLDVNLLPERKRRLTTSQILIGYIMVFVVCIFAVVTPYIYFFSSRKSYTEANQKLAEEIAKAKKRNAELKTEAENYAGLSQRLIEVKKLFMQHIYWSRFFPSLQKHTGSQVYFTNLEVRPDWEATLSGVAKNLHAVAEQLVVFQNSGDYEEVVLNNISFNVKAEEIPGAGDDDEPLEFAMKFRINPQILYDEVPEVVGE